MINKKNLITYLVLLSSTCFIHAQKSVTSYSKFKEIPLTQISPKGWLHQYLVIQKNGLTGHLDEVAGYPFTSAGWGRPVQDEGSWWPYEQTGYWFDGLIRCAYLLNDTFLINKSKKILDFVLVKNIGKDGFIGPDYLRKEGENNYWVFAVFFRALMADYYATKDVGILEKMKRHDMLLDYSKEIREGVNIENLLWLYNQTGDISLLNKAESIFKTFVNYPCVAASYKGEKSEEHGVTFDEAAKIGAIMYMYTGNKDYLKYSTGAFDLLDKYYMMVDGVNVSTEGLHTPVNSLRSHETCDIADYTWSAGYLLMATGEAKYADRIEKAIFNAAPGCVTSDFKALQYFSCPNQVIAGVNTNHNKFFKGNHNMAFAPNPWTACCAGEVNRIMPNYAARMWMKTDNNGIAAVFYGPSEITFKPGKSKQDVSIKEITDYPFSDEIEFEILTDKPANFPFTVRVPEWSKDAKIYYNGKECDNVKPGAFFTIKSNFKNHDKVKVVLPSKLKFKKWADGGISLEKGPLVYSLKIKEERRIRIPNPADPRSNKDFPAYEFYPASEWNYALAIDTNKLEEQVKFIRTENKNVNPWEVPQMKMIVPVKKVDDWKIILENDVIREQGVAIFKDDKQVDWKFEPNHHVNGEFLFTPPLPSKEDLLKSKANKTEYIELVPYGCAKLRVTIFPLVN